jgi:ribose 5-phosphate isomerase B
MEKIVIGSDHGGFRLKQALGEYLLEKGFRVYDVGTYSPERCDYPLTSFVAAKAVSEARFKRGILICKSGIGNSIVANKLPRVRAALCHSVRAARLSRQHNDSNMLVLGAGFSTLRQAKQIVSVWLSTEFEGGRHRKRLNQILQIEKTLCKERKK